MAPNGRRVCDNFREWFGASAAIHGDGTPLIVHHGTSDAGFSSFDADQIDPHHVGFFFTSCPAVAASYGSDDAVELRTPPAFATVSDVRRYLESQKPFEGQTLHLLERRQVLDDETDAPRIYREYVLFWSGSSGSQEIGEYRPELQRSDLRRMAQDAVLALAKGPLRSGTYSVYLSIQKPLVVDAGGTPWMAIPFEGDRISISGISGIAKERGFDGLIVRNAYDSNVVLDRASDIFVAFDPRQIKSATANSGDYDPRSPSVTDAEPAPQPRARRTEPAL